MSLKAKGTFEMAFKGCFRSWLMCLTSCFWRRNRLGRRLGRNRNSKGKYLESEYFTSNPLHRIMLPENHSAHKHQLSDICKREKVH